MATFDGYEPVSGHVTLAVAFQAQPPFLAAIPIAHHIDTLKEVEQAYSLRRADRTARDAQIRLRELAYTMVHDKGVADVAVGLAKLIYWLAINHYDQGAALRTQLSDLLSESDSAVISVMVVGDSEKMRWGFAVGGLPVDFSDMLPILPDTQPLFVQAPATASRVIN